MKLATLIDKDRFVKMVKEARGRHDLFLVGGTIRDLLLNRDPVDYDFAVSGSGIRFARSFSRRVKGAFVLLSQADDEARVVKDELILDFVGLGRSSILEDLTRRDFTINAMAFDLGSGQFLDPHGGAKDLKKKILRPITDKSLSADPLRILRGFRLALELKFKLARDFFRLGRTISLKKVAAERIGYELIRIMAAPDSYENIVKMNKLGLFLQIFPEARKIIEDDYLWGHSLSTYQAIEHLLYKGFFAKLEPEFARYFAVPRRIPLLKLAGLFHDVAKPDTFLLKEGAVHFYGHDAKGARIIEDLGYKRLKLSRNDVLILKRLVKEHMRPHLLATQGDLTDRAIRRFFRDLGDEWLAAMMLAWADGYATAGYTRHLENTFTRMIELKRQDEAKPRIARLVNGYDLIALGLKPGPIFKIILQELFDMQLEGRIKDKDEARQIALDLYKKLSDGPHPPS